MSIIAKRRTVTEAGITWQPTEEQEQAAVMEWAVLMEKQAPELALLFHVPNGGVRHPGTAARLKKLGVKPGVPDLCLPVARGGWHGLFIEMKRQKGGRLSDDQKAWLEALNDGGYRAERCDGAEAACDLIWQYLQETEQ